MRSNAFDPKGSSRCWGCFGCRRRNLSGKILSIVLQIVIVVVVWIVVKKSCSVEGQDGITVRRIHSVDGQGASLCNHGDYVKGTALRIEDIVSVSGSQEQKQFFLEVDILTRDVEQGSPILYTVGSPVIVDGLFKDDDLDLEKEEGEEKSEFYYDNSIDDPHALPGENGEYDLPEDNDDGKEEPMIEEETIDMEEDNTQSENEDGTILENSHSNAYQDVDGGQILQNINSNNILHNREQLKMEMNPPAMHKIAETQNQQNQMGDLGIQQHQEQIAIGLGQQHGVDTLGVPIQQQQRQAGIQYQQNQLNIQNGQTLNQFGGRKDIAQDKPLNYVGVQQWPGQENKLPFGMQHRPNDFAVDDGVNINAVNKQNQNIPADNKALFQMNQGQETISIGNSMTESEGFKERLTRFKTEFYGRPVDGSSEQTPTTYMMNNPTLCQNTADVINVLFVVHTIPQSDDQRQRIRDTFANASLFKPFKIAHVFLVGQTSSPNFQGNLGKEQEQYNDIVQGGFMDSPETRANKGLMGLQWVNAFCPQARFVMKIDEDVFVDTDKLLQGLIPATTNVIWIKSILCFLVQNASIPRSGPNALNHNLFPNTAKMRPFCKGFAVLMTAGVINSLVSASEHVPVFRYDDLYLYGILPYLAGGIKVYDVGDKRAFHDFGMAVVSCYKELGDNCPYVATKAFSSRFTSLWEFVVARKESGANRFQANPSLWSISDYQRSFYT